MNFPIFYRIICDLCGRYAPGMFYSKDSVKEEAIRIRWLEDRPDNGHKCSDTDPLACCFCGAWRVFWPYLPCEYWIVECVDCMEGK